MIPEFHEINIDELQVALMEIFVSIDGTMYWSTNKVKFTVPI